VRAVSAAAGRLCRRVPSVARLSLSLQALGEVNDDGAAKLESCLAAIDVAALEVRERPRCAANLVQVVAGRLSALLARLPGLRGLDVYGIGSLHDFRRVRRREKAAASALPAAARPCSCSCGLRHSLTRAARSPPTQPHQ
jgi:hypothetical protein